MSIKLKPCPFCGRRKGLTCHDIMDDNHEQGVAVFCPSSTCCNGPVRKTYEGAEQAWNRRKTAEFDAGVLWAAARLVEFHDQPTLAKELLIQSGADLSKATALDAPFIQQALD